MNIKRALVAEEVLAPDQVQQPVRGHGDADVLSQRHEQVELLGAQRHGRAGDARLAPKHVDAQIADLDHLGRPLARLAAAQDRLDPRHKLPRVERLGQVVVGADLEADDLVHVVAAGREHDDRDVAFAPQRAADLHAVDLGQHQVEHDQRGLEGARLLQRLAAVVGGSRW